MWSNRIPRISRNIVAQFCKISFNLELYVDVCLCVGIGVNRASDPPGSGVIDGCELTCVGDGNQI